MSSPSSYAEVDFPVVVRPVSSAQASALRQWAECERGWIDGSLWRHGAVLLRGFSLPTPGDFEDLCRALAPQLLGYVGGESPRRRVTGLVYTSTEYPSSLEIPLHGEMSYAGRWPDRIFFHCVEPATAGGETTIADTRRLLAAIAPEVRDRFIEKGVMYMRNLHGGWGLGKSWQETYETDDRVEVERRCREDGFAVRWSDGGLQTRAVRPATVRHPQTGEIVWFNQADLWHVSSRGPAAERSLRRVFKEDELPRNAYHGDGSPIAAEDLEAIRGASRAVEVAVSWEKGDVLLLDNVLAAHGRRPFAGPRQVLVAMG